MCNDVMMIRQVIRTRGKKMDNLLIAGLFSVSDHIVTIVTKSLQRKMKLFGLDTSDLCSSFSTLPSPCMLYKLPQYFVSTVKCCLAEIRNMTRD